MPGRSRAGTGAMSQRPTSPPMQGPHVHHTQPTSPEEAGTCSLTRRKKPPDARHPSKSHIPIEGYSGRNMRLTRPASPPPPHQDIWPPRTCYTRPMPEPKYYRPAGPALPCNFGSGLTNVQARQRDLQTLTETLTETINTHLTLRRKTTGISPPTRLRCCNTV